MHQQDEIIFHFKSMRVADSVKDYGCRASHSPLSDAFGMKTSSCDNCDKGGSSREVNSAPQFLSFRMPRELLIY